MITGLLLSEHCDINEGGKSLGMRRLETAHRETAIADTYTLITRPSIDRLYESITGEPNPYPSGP